MIRVDPRRVRRERFAASFCALVEKNGKTVESTEWAILYDFFFGVKFIKFDSQ